MSSSDAGQERLIEAQVREWIARVVIDLNLCPFARKPFEAGQVKVVVSAASDPEALLQDLHDQLAWLEATPPGDTETTLLVVPRMLADFLDYNDFLDLADALLERFAWQGDFQIASFHPDYQFAGTRPEDAENYTNRAPWPLLHLLREDSLEKAVASHPDPEQIPERNIEMTNRHGSAYLMELLDACRRVKTD